MNKDKGLTYSDLRASFGLNKAEWASVVGMHRVTWSYIEGKHRTPTRAQLDALLPYVKLVGGTAEDATDLI